MSRGLNKVMIIGHLGRDPEMRYTPSQKAVTNFNVASSRSWKTAEGERRSETEWFRGQSPQHSGDPRQRDDYARTQSQERRQRRRRC